MSRKAAFDEENPEWTEADFKASRPASDLPADVLAAFPRTRGPQKSPKKVPISIRLSPEIIERFKAGGPGWQARMEAALKSAVGL